MKSGNRIVEGVLWFVAAFSSFWALLWVLGPNGLGETFIGSLPRWLEPAYMYGGGYWATQPTTLVDVQAPAVYDILEGYSRLNPLSEGEMLPGDAELYAGSFISLGNPASAERFWYLATQVLVCVAVAAIAVLLARMVASARTESPFNRSNVRRLRLIGAVLLVGAPLVSLAEWVCLRSMVEGSTLANQVRMPGYELANVPLWTMVVGAAVLVLADVWRRGVQMTYDVQGLV